MTDSLKILFLIFSKCLVKLTHSTNKKKKVKNSAGSKLKSKQLKLRCGGGGQIKHLVKGG